MSLKVMPFFARNKEKSVIEDFQKLKNKLREGKDKFLSCGKYFLDDNYDLVEKSEKEIKIVEEECDDIVWNTTLKLYQGAFLPTTRVHLHNLLQLLDNVMDQMYHSSSMFKYMKKKKFPEEVKGLFWKQIQENARSVEQLILILEKLFENNSDLLDDIQTAKKMEHKSDIYEKEIFDYILTKRRFDETSGRLISEITKLISSISDAVEDSCYEIAVLKLLRQA